MLIVFMMLPLPHAVPSETASGAYAVAWFG